MAGMVPEDVYQLTGVSEPRLSPDGRRVAYTVWWVDPKKGEYRSAIWVVPVDGSEEPRRVTFGPKRDGRPRWSPDGTRLGFVSKRKGDASQLYVLPLDGGEAHQLTDLKEDVDQVVWSPDGTRLAFVSRVRDDAYEEEDPHKRRPRRFTRLQYKLDDVGWTGDRRQHVFVVPADGSAEPIQLTHGDHEDAKPAWSPDGTRIVFVFARHQNWDLSMATDLYLVGAGGGEPEGLTSTDGSVDAPSWSPDGASIGYLYYPAVMDDPRHTQLAVIDVATRDRRVLTASLDRNCGPYPELREPAWEGASALLFGVEDRGRTHLYRVAADGSGAPDPVVEGDLVLTGFDAVDGQVVHSATTLTSLSELYAGDRRLTDVGRAFVEGREIVEAERFTAVAPDGAEVDAWIIRPAGFEPGARYPTLLNIHGGPFTQYGTKLFDEFQVYAGAGYAVVFSNPRGSSGYSERWGRAIRGDGTKGDGWGSVDYDDLMAVVDEAVKRFDFVDPDRLGVMGGSYGGYMTSWMVGHTDRFAVGISERSCNQFVSMWGASDIGWDFKGYFGSFLHEDVDTYLRLSPATYAKDINTPLLILHSENDLRCPVEQAEQLFTTLRLLKRPVEMVRFPDESHELTRSGNPVHRVMRFEVILEWLGRHLKPEGSEAKAEASATAAASS